MLSLKRIGFEIDIGISFNRVMILSDGSRKIIHLSVHPLEKFIGHIPGVNFYLLATINYGSAA